MQVDRVGAVAGNLLGCLVIEGLKVMLQFFLIDDNFLFGIGVGIKRAGDALSEILHRDRFGGLLFLE